MRVWVGSRETIAWVAGLAGMAWARFLFWNAFGGIVWATANILHPQQMLAGPDWLELAPDDFARVGKLVEAEIPDQM